MSAQVPSRGRRRLIRSGAGWFAAAGLALAPGGGRAVSAEGSTSDPRATTPNDIDVGFFTDMSYHHAQALVMCQIVLGSTAGDQVQAAAAEILQGQSYERGLMHAWLQLWGESTAPPAEVMAWMGMPTPAAEMIGLAPDESLRDLATLEGVAKGRLFLELMRVHHLAGVHMAEAAAAAQTTHVRQLAANMVLIQTFEISVFDQLLATTYA